MLQFVMLSVPWGNGAQGARGKWGEESLLWLPQQEVGEAGSAGLGLASLNDFSRLRSMGAACGLLYLPGGNQGRVLMAWSMRAG